MKNILMVIAPEEFKDEEYFIVRGIFEEGGHKVFTASSIKDARSVNGKIVKVDYVFPGIISDNFDAVVFVGGPGAELYLHDSFVHDLAIQFFNAGKVTAAICMAPSILANAGVLSGKYATCFRSEEENLRQKGAKVTSELVTQDGIVVTGRGPEAAQEFANKVLTML
jgi:protease I